MTVHINTVKWHVEHDSGLLWITNRETGLTTVFAAKGIVAELKKCLKTHTPDQVAATFSRMPGPNARWDKIYKTLPDLPMGLMLKEEAE